MAASTTRQRNSGSVRLASSARELDVVGVAAGLANGGPGHGQHILARGPELVPDVQVGGGDEDVHPAPGRRAQRLAGELDVALVAAGQRGDDRPAHLGGDLPHPAVIALRCRREPGLDDVHAEGVELPGESELLLGGKPVAGSLLAIAQGRVEDQDVGDCHTGTARRIRVKRKAPRTFRSAAPVIRGDLLSHVARVGTPRAPRSPIRTASRTLRTRTSTRLSGIGSSGCVSWGPTTVGG